MIAILDDIRSVHNVGSIFRTADALGADKIFCCGITPGPLDRFKKVRADFAKVSLGAEDSVEWERVQSAADVVKQLRKDSWHIFAVEQAKDSIPYYKVDGFTLAAPGARIALIVGNEVDGVAPGLLKLADKILEIPMHGRKESLNVSVAFGIVAFGLRDHMLESKKG